MANTARNLGKYSEQGHFAGERIGDTHNADGTVGLLLVERLHDDDGYLLGQAIFECPKCGKRFKASIKDVLSGRTVSCPNCAADKKTVHKIGEYIGTFENGDGLPDGMLVLERDTKSKTFLVKCPKCGAVTTVTKNTILKASKSPCPVCKWNDAHPDKAYHC